MEKALEDLKRSQIEEFAMGKTCRTLSTELNQSWTSLGNYMVPAVSPQVSEFCNALLAVQGHLVATTEVLAASTSMAPALFLTKCGAEFDATLDTVLGQAVEHELKPQVEAMKRYETSREQLVTAIQEVSAKSNALDRIHKTHEQRMSDLWARLTKEESQLAYAKYKQALIQTCGNDQMKRLERLHERRAYLEKKREAHQNRVANNSSGCRVRFSWFSVEWERVSADQSTWSIRYIDDELTEVVAAISSNLNTPLPEGQPPDVIKQKIDITKREIEDATKNHRATREEGFMDMSKHVLLDRSQADQFVQFMDNITKLNEILTRIHTYQITTINNFTKVKGAKVPPMVRIALLKALMLQSSIRSGLTGHEMSTLLVHEHFANVLSQQSQLPPGDKGVTAAIEDVQRSERNVVNTAAGCTVDPLDYQF
eukprot:GHVN01079024.1.p1 GENE.GHVN01079024.1~~GHVN01079024.1.p1  ORF type:complete len:426 (+),score=49.19 GHVN01079024.1:1440-2717(+)